ncbi:SDR family NAD(P)-dependent oxidoreductase [Gracilimonas mengyeensis]|uniref:Short-chain dehydrogenase n=1 Tax=Gracilimonas mengyeensis TaxID=1302730 RepID=A0A521ATQ7_9BACT|nr:SDR family NAD(P)-dependent oxidoreductase [Gracilimonas mengyeensis]SMO38000.1 hypothetical protein SAMN06265219_101358 [Gracilimonas mengyeensis]
MEKTYGPWALITGASSGIGKEFAYQLASKDINLVLSSRRKQVLEKIGRDVQEKFGIQYQAIRADLSEENAVDELLQSVSDLDIGLVVSNAGTGNPGEFIHKKMDDLLSMIHTSVLTHLKISHHFANKFVERGRGGLILVSAMGAKNGLPFMANDAGTRAYIRSLGLGLHEELRRYKVNVTVLETTPTDTPIVPALGFEADKMPLNPINTKQCVKETLSAFQKNQPLVLPGRKFRILSALTPSSLMRKMNGKMLAKGNGINGYY